MNIILGVNTGFAINRFPEPDDWTSIVRDELGLDTVQFTADLLNPFLPEDLVRRQVDAIRTCCEAKGIRIQTTFTSQFTRVNHLLHPDADLRRSWFEWFKKFFRMSRDLGAEGSGSHFGILSVRDDRDAALRERRVEQGVRAWRKLSEAGAEFGLEYLLFEPMSVSREIGETITATREILDRCADGFAIPMKLCLDVDHGDVHSPDPRDTDPRAWIRELGLHAPCIHIKQSLHDKSGHYPFIPEYNRQGRVVPHDILSAMRDSGIERCTLLLEISHRERRPYDQRVVDDLKQSVAYWRPAIDAANRSAAPA